jgi:hypothetical protein
MATTFTELPKVGDVILHEESVMHNYDSVTITNPHSSEFTFKVGYPINGATPVAAAAIANTTGILAQNIKLAASATAKVAIMRRGPGVVNKAALPTTDYAGASFNMTTFQSEIEALGIVVRTEQTPLVTQQI